MIRCDMAKVRFEGSRIVLHAELTTIMNSFVQQGVFDKEYLINCVETACMTEKELKESVKKRREQFSTGTAEFIEGLVKLICGFDKDKEGDD